MPERTMSRLWHVQQERDQLKACVAELEDELQHFALIFLMS
jgi:hypothetical protein